MPSKAELNPEEARKKRNEKARKCKKGDKTEELCRECACKTLNECPCGVPVCKSCASAIASEDGLLWCGDEDCVLAVTNKAEIYLGDLFQSNPPHPGSPTEAKILAATDKRWQDDKRVPGGGLKTGYQECPMGTVIKTGPATRFFKCTLCECCGTWLCDACGNDRRAHPEPKKNLNEFGTDPGITQARRTYCETVNEATAKRVYESQLRLACEASLEPQRKRRKVKQEVRVKPEPVEQVQVKAEPLAQVRVKAESPAQEQEQPAPAEQVQELPEPAEQVQEPPEPVQEQPAPAEQVQELPAQVQEQPAPVEQVQELPAQVQEHPAPVEQVQELPAQVQEHPAPAEQVHEQPAPAEQVQELPAQVQEQLEPAEQVQEQPEPAEKVPEQPEQVPQDSELKEEEESDEEEEEDSEEDDEEEEESGEEEEDDEEEDEEQEEESEEEEETFESSQEESANLKRPAPDDEQPEPKRAKN